MQVPVPEPKLSQNQVSQKKEGTCRMNSPLRCSIIYFKKINLLLSKVGICTLQPVKKEILNF